MHSRSGCVLAATATDTEHAPDVLGLIAVLGLLGAHAAGSLMWRACVGSISNECTSRSGCAAAATAAAAASPASNPGAASASASTPTSVLPSSAAACHKMAYHKHASGCCSSAMTWHHPGMSAFRDAHWAQPGPTTSDAWLYQQPLWHAIAPQG